MKGLREGTEAHNGRADDRADNVTARRLKLDRLNRVVTGERMTIFINSFAINND